MAKQLLSMEHEDDVIDRALVTTALNGDREALEALIRRHQSPIYNISVRMLGTPADAEDATQEILLRLITHLASYRAEAAFATWAYRITIRYLLAFRSRRSNLEHTFADFGQTLDGTPDEELSDDAAPSVDNQLMVEEVKATCLSGLLLCLDREQRLAFVLGEIFEATDVVCAELLGISRENVRQRINRAREQLRSFLTGRCGLVDPSNPCRCARKTQAFSRQGFVDPSHLRFTRGLLETVNGQATEGVRRLEALVDETFARLLRDQPVGAEPDLTASLLDCLNRRELRETLELDS